MHSEPIIATIILLSALFLPNFGLAASGGIVINEIAWMGTTVSANDEWVELYNPTEQAVNLGGWILKTADNKLNIKLSGNIGPGSFYLLERTDEESAPAIAADLIYSGALANDGEHLQLYDATGLLIDEVNCSEKWLAGNNTAKQTMERGPSTSSGQGWQDSQNPGGTPKAPNILSVIVPKVFGNSSQQLPTNGQEGAEGKNEGIEFYSDGIVINEVLPSPDGPDETEEWVELKNTNSQEVNIAGWQIKDTTGTIKTYKLPVGAKISGYGFFVLSRPVSKISLNNTGDGLILLWPDGQIIDQVSYEKALLGQSWNRVKNGWAWSAVLTPNKENIISQPIVAVSKVNQTKKAPMGASSQETAAIGQSMQELLATTSTAIQGIFAFDWPVSVFFFALALAILSAIAILLLRRFLYRNHSTT